MAAAALILGAPRLLSLPEIQGRVRTSLSGILGHGVAWEAMTLSLVSGTLDVTGFELGNPGGETHIRLDRFRVDLDWEPLLTGTLCVEELVLERPDVAFTISGARDVPRDGTAKGRDFGPGLPWFLPIRSLDVHHARITSGSLVLTLPGAGSQDTPGRIDIQGISLIGSGTGEPSAAVSLEIQGGKVDLGDISTRLEASHLTGVLRKDRLEALSLSLVSDLAHITGAGQVQELFSSRELDLDLGIATKVAAITSVLQGTDPGTGDLKAHVRITGPLDSPRISAELDAVSPGLGDVHGESLHGRFQAVLDPSSEPEGLPGITMDYEATVTRLSLRSFEPDAVSLSGRLEFKDNCITLVGTTLGLTGAELRTYGTYCRETGSVRAHLDLDVPDINAPASRQGLTGCSGSLGVGVDLTGTLDEPRAVMAFTADRLNYQDRVLGDITGNLILESSGRLTVSSLTVRNLDATVQAEGHVDLFTPDRTVPESPACHIRVAFTHVEPRHVYPPLPVSGTLDGVMEILGSLSAPAITLKAKARSMAWEGSTIPGLDLDLDLAAGPEGQNFRVNLHSATVRTRGSGVDLTGSLFWPGPLGAFEVAACDVDLSVSGPGLDLEDFIPGVQGRLLLEGKAWGNLVDPGATLFLTGDGLAAAGRTAQGLEAGLRLDQGRIFLDYLDLSLTRENTVNVRGWVDPGQGIHELHLTGDLADLNRLADSESTFPDTVRLRADLRSQGRLENPVASGRLDLSGLLPWDRSSIRSLGFDLDFRDAVLTVSGPVDLPVRARLDTRSLEFTAALTLENTDLTALARGLTGQDLTGMASARVQIRGNGGDADSILGSLDIHDVFLNHQGRPLIGVKNARVVYGAGTVTLPGLALTFLGKEGLTLRGTAGINGLLDLHMEGSVPMDALASLTGVVDSAQGFLNLNASVTGILDRPEIRMDLSMTDVGMAFPDLEESLRDVNANLRITPESVVIHYLEGKFGTGDIRVSGEARLSGLDIQRADIHLVALGLPLGVPDTADTLFDATLGLTGTPGQFLISGDIVLVEGTYYRPVNIRQVLAGITERRAGPGPVADSDPVLAGISLDVTLGYKDLFRVDNNLAVMVLKPDLKVTGSLARPLLTGRAQVVSGSVFFQDTEFEVIRGIVDFVNPYRVEPLLDIQSRTRIRKWTIDLYITGTPDALKLTLKSSPAEEDGDILSLIAVGKTTRELAGGGGGKSVSPSQVIAGMVADQISDTVKSSTGLDEVTVKYAEAEGRASPEVDITLGKELSQRLAVTYRIETKDGITVQRAAADYTFLENLLIRSYQDTAGDYGGELIFRLEFR